MAFRVSQLGKYTDAMFTKIHAGNVRIVTGVWRSTFHVCLGDIRGMGVYGHMSHYNYSTETQEEQLPQEQLLQESKSSREKRKTSKTPHAVRLMRKSMRDLHQLSLDPLSKLKRSDIRSGTLHGDFNDVTPAGNSQITTFAQFESDIGDSPEPNQRAQSEKKGARLRQNNTQTAAFEQVVKTHYGVLRVDQPLPEVETENHFTCGGDSEQVLSSTCSTNDESASQNNHNQHEHNDFGLLKNDTLKKTSSLSGQTPMNDVEASSNLFDSQYFEGVLSTPEGYNDGYGDPKISNTEQTDSCVKRHVEKKIVDGETELENGVVNHSQSSLSSDAHKVAEQDNFLVSEQKRSVADDNDRIQNDDSLSGNFIDSQYFDNLLTPSNKVTVSADSVPLNNLTHEGSSCVAEGTDKFSRDSLMPEPPAETSKSCSVLSFKEEISNVFDDYYFSGDTLKETAQTGAVDLPHDSISSKAEHDAADTNENEMSVSRESESITHAETSIQRPDIVVGDDAKSQVRSDKSSKRHCSPLDNTNSKNEKDRNNTAYDMVMKLRRNRDDKKEHIPVPRESQWYGQKDSRGFRILKDQVVDIQNLMTSHVVKILKDSILYEDDRLIAVDKPYGLPSHGGPGVHNSVGQLLPSLAQKLLNPDLDLKLVHRLDKETTGVMLLAKDAKAQNELREMFKKRRVIKKYLMITKGVPSPEEGVVDIPMIEGCVGNRHRMTLRPHYTSQNKLMLKMTSSLPKGSDAVTNYRTLDSNYGCALVECHPETGLKHQIRCHMSFALNTPLLGDHKYSHYSKMAPQRLFPETLQRLGIRQAKVRHLPLHLHAQLLILPEYKDGRNLFIRARLPRHFVQNMKWLKLKIPD